MQANHRCEETRQRLAQGAYLIDVRSLPEYQQDGLPNALNHPIDTLEKTLHAFDKEDELIVYCASGFRSNMAKQLLIESGFERVFDLGDKNNIHYC